MTDPVLQWAPIAKEASKETGVPVPTLLGLIKVESGGVEGLTSSAGAGGLTQFEPGTAKSYGVDVSPGHARSQIFGAAHYLKDLGYASNPTLALAKYNAGPGNPGAAGSYPADVLNAARKYMSVKVSGDSAPSTAAPSAGAQTTVDATQGSDLFSEVTGGLKYATVWVAVVLAGLAVAGYGLFHAAGQARPRVTPA